MKKLFVILFLIVSTPVLAVENLIDGGDVLRISVYGNPDLTTEAKVSEAGSVNFPLIGEVRVSGLSAPDTEQRIGQRLIADGFLRQAQVNVIVLQSSSQQVSVLGQVAKPGKYSIETGAKTLFDFVAISGGVSAKGSDVITIIRMEENPPKRISVNINKLFLDSNAAQINSANMEMQAGDIIYVPEAPVVYVYGEANRPGVYRFKPGMTVAQAISAGGGISARGTENGLQIKRRNEKNGVVDEIDVTISTIIYADDVVTIQESLF
ncbi:MAG: SLBB domain-containing protein [Pseudomonadota bacterium]|nr:SLBB domain-containing protein [Pseudomonadota bacterium]